MSSKGPPGSAGISPSDASALRRVTLGDAAAIAQALGRSLDELVEVSAEATFEPPKMGRPRRADRP